MSKFPPFYPILDAEVAGDRTLQIAESLAGAGVELIQFRNKSGTPRQTFATCLELMKVLQSRARLIVNDRADIAAMCGAGGVHVGQDDLSVTDARAVLGSPSSTNHLPQSVERERELNKNENWVGISTHNLQQFQQADQTSADYIAIGPIFATSTKKNPDPVVGLEFISRTRALTKKPLVAIGGITLHNASQVWRAGADSIAVIGDVLLAPSPALRAREYLALASQFAQPAHPTPSTQRTPPTP